ncbi:outer membrane protein assembly factor BamE [Jannaschia aquimarina]|uniref:SmpA / OmlA family protein n=1 Tax=Jannaschia aquimarina TaxID=935700 RepID=A0A0D1EQ80_9RHOB|nr:outer membrane protein assembly factor BamE [Jannaschia aquimarina]KIT17770.1 SmpA / OmlA family protein [Jannaschia aquimarina]SNS95808.1 Beta-barrel assembly machine subunit BamE [Jannaschia aquimarina]
MLGRLIALAGLTVALVACGPVYRNHGYIPEDADLSALVVGVDTIDSVETTVGRPSASGVLREDAWYYVRERRRQFGPGASRPVSRELVAISFAENGTIENIERFGLEDGRVVTLSRRVTETSIRDFGLIQQIIRNFGRINIGEALAEDN